MPMTQDFRINLNAPSSVCIPIQSHHLSLLEVPNLYWENGGERINVAAVTFSAKRKARQERQGDEERREENGFSFKRQTCH